MKTTDLFKIHVARSHSFQDYSFGKVAFISNGFSNNGVQGFVDPFDEDKVFQFEGISVSAFCEATVQKPPFLGRGNGGSGMIILEPLKPMETKELLFYASYINTVIRWRFSYGRMVSKERILRLIFPNDSTNIQEIKTDDYLPTRQSFIPKNFKINYESVPISNLFELHSGDFHNASNLSNGNIPLVSCGEVRNGIIKFIKVSQKFVYENTLTIAYNGRPLTTKYHPYLFAAKDDVAVCIKKKEMPPETLIFIQYLIESERWRFSYGRKCFREKLMEMKLDIPVNANGEIDNTKIKDIVTTTSYWPFLNKTYKETIYLIPQIIEN